jgi:flagellin
MGTTASTAGVAAALANPGATAGAGSAVTFPGTPTTAAAAGVGEVDTLTMGADTDSLSGTLSVAVAGGTAISVNLAAGTSLANAVTALNGNAGFSGAGLVAAQGTGAASNTITITGPTGAANTLDLTASSLTDTTAPGNAPVTGSGTYTLTNASDTVSGTLSVAVNGGTAVTATLAAGTSLADAVTQLNANAGFTGAGLTASVGTGANANQLIIKGGTTDSLDMSASTLSDTPAAVAGPGVDFTGTAASLTAANATSVLTSVTSAIQDIDYQRGNIGASINELNAASNVASAESVNLTSAEDSVRSTNYGQATSNMASLQVLSQTGISALAQANSVQQEILKLMQ